MEKAILVGLHLPGSTRIDVLNSINELSRLAETAGAKPEDIIIQGRNKIDPAYFIGKGKASELKEKIEKTKIKTIFFDEDLKPVQQKNLEELIGAKIVDRSRLILDIFSKRARSKEGILQVERAQLEYFLPRITARFGTFEQQTGGIGTRGPGERKLEVDQRRVRERIAHLDREIKSISFHRNVSRQKRLATEQPVIAIVGYTNAGKSTFLNSLVGQSSVYADDKLFATLDPTTRKVKMPGGRTVLFTDTVGFIKKLPHTLVAAFKSTLEEITLSNCILHIIDASQPDYEEQVSTVLKVLKELNADQIPMVNVYNKADIISYKLKNQFKKHDSILISARNNMGIEDLLKRVEDIVIPKVYPHKLTIPYKDNKFISAVHKLAVVKKQKYTSKGVSLNIEATDIHWEKIKTIVKKQ